jgi:hypothetical protein
VAAHQGERQCGVSLPTYDEFRSVLRPSKITTQNQFRILSKRPGAAVGVDGSEFRIESDRFSGVGNGAVVVAFFVPFDAAIVAGARRRIGTLQRNKVGAPTAGSGQNR